MWSTDLGLQALRAEVFEGSGMCRDAGYEVLGQVWIKV
jgi:hypothetical protein